MSDSLSVVTLIRPAALTKAFALSSSIAPPIGIAYIGGILRHNGIDVRILDALGESLEQMLPLDFCNGYSVGLSIEETVARIDENSDIIGVSCMFSSSWPYDHRLIRRIRERFPQATIVIGGEHATACADYVLQTCADVDICVLGEGEETMLELVRALRAGGDLSIISSLAYRGADGAAIQTERRKRIDALDNIPLPAWDITPIRNYLDRGIGHGSSSKRSMPLLATRGCPFQCTFCSNPHMWTTRWDSRDYKLVVDEMEFYMKEYGAENFDLYDLTAIIRKDWIINFANEILGRGMKITYQLPSGTRSEAIDEEACDYLVRSGCINMNYAPETGSPETLVAIKKKVKLPKLLASLRAASKSGMRIMVHTILFPDDKWKDVLQTFRFMVQCAWNGCHDISFVPYVPYPGSELHASLVAQKRLEPLCENYFIRLLTHSDLAEANSYNPNFTSSQVKIMRLLYLGGFYFFCYLFRPYRIPQNIIHVLRNEPTTKGEKALILLLQRIRKTRLLKAG